INTVRVDDPLLTVRRAPGASPLRVVLASTLELPPAARVLGRDAGLLVIGAAGRAAPAAAARLEAARAAVAIVPATAEGMVSIDGALALLTERGVARVLVEGGARVLTSFLRAGKVDRMEIEIAPRLLGAPGTAVVGQLGEPLPALANVAVARLGANVL